MTEDSGLESFKALLSTASSTIGGAEPVKVTETVADQPDDNKDDIDERDTQLKELKEELARLSDDYSELTSQKSSLERQL